MTQNSLVTAKQQRGNFSLGCTLRNILLILKFACFRLIKALQQFGWGSGFKHFFFFLATMYLPDLLHISFNPQNSLANIASLLMNLTPEDRTAVNFSVSRNSLSIAQDSWDCLCLIFFFFFFWSTYHLPICYMIHLLLLLCPSLESKLLEGKVLCFFTQAPRTVPSMDQVLGTYLLNKWLFIIFAWMFHKYLIVHSCVSYIPSFI